MWYWTLKADCPEDLFCCEICVLQLWENEWITWLRSCQAVFVPQMWSPGNFLSPDLPYQCGYVPSFALTLQRMCCLGKKQATSIKPQAPSHCANWNRAIAKLLLAMLAPADSSNIMSHTLEVAWSIPSQESCLQTCFHKVFCLESET